MTQESLRLQAAREQGVPWRKWGPYLSERQWGTVREDYSSDGNAWDYFSHDQARSRAYRNGEDGLAGISDEKQQLCFALALWNGKDPIMKERLFGLTNREGNHGEDVKEYYYYLDSTPTHSYMRYLYKYPQRAYPYDQLVKTNRERSRTEAEFELIDTGVFDDDRYFDIFVEYAKADTQDILIRITAHNRGNEKASLHLLPTLWFRNTWSWTPDASKPSLSAQGANLIVASHEEFGTVQMGCDGKPQLLFTENESNTARLAGHPNRTPFVKDGINDHIVHGKRGTLNPALTGTKAAAHYAIEVPAGGSQVVQLRLGDASGKLFGKDFDSIFTTRQREADEFYETVVPSDLNDDHKQVIRQALAGMMWSKQQYYFDVHSWLADHGVDAMNPQSSQLRNRDWYHMVNDHVISMPDKWEYPWYAAWDLAFHVPALAMVDIDFAKEQLDLMLGGMYLHPNGQIPAYEWNFSDVNPPVHAWSTLFLYRTEQAKHGKGDRGFLERIFGKLMLNFTWWVNRKDRLGKNVYEGGFLGLDNIGVFDRSAALPTGGCLEQADGTAWMALFCQNMFEICVELAAEEPTYDHLSCKFADQFLWIASGLNRVGPDGIWDEADGFYYDVLRLPDGSAQRLKIRSLVGLLPMCATTILEPWQRERMPHLVEHFDRRLKHLPKLRDSIHPVGLENQGFGGRTIAALVTPEKLRRILSRMLNENEFFSPHGIRSISRAHKDHPYVMHVKGDEHRVDYLPAESDSGTFGGNSNWRGPVWMPVNAIIIRALLQFYLFYGDNFIVECPTGSGQMMNLFEVARELVDRLARIFLRDADGRRPVFGAAKKFQTDPHFKDYLLFYEYFHGDDGSGIGASHQTGWTGLIAKEIEIFAKVDAKQFLKGGLRDAFQRVAR